jgi:ATP-binding cassette, subfamily B, multidrug efflux pump
MMTQTINQRARSDDARPAVQARHPMGFGKIEKARDARHALTRLAPYLNPFRPTLAFVFVCVILYTALGLIGPYLLGVAIDQYIVPKRLDGLPFISLVMLGAYLLNNLFQAISGWLMASVSQRALKQLRQDLFDHLQTLPMRFFDQNPV